LETLTSEGFSVTVSAVEAVLTVALCDEGELFLFLFFGGLLSFALVHF
jgi:hypothetical protein